MILQFINEVLVMLKIEFLSEQAKRWLNYTRYGWNIPNSHLYKKEYKIENNHMSHSISHNYRENFVCH